MLTMNLDLAKAPTGLYRDVTDAAIEALPADEIVPLLLVIRLHVPAASWAGTRIVNR